MSAASRKKVRFSGKKSGKRVRLVCRASTSVSAKSVFTVSEARALVPSRCVTSRLGSRMPSVERLRRRVLEASDEGGAHAEAQPEIEAGKPGEQARLARLEDRVVLPRARPAVRLLQSLDAPLDVEAPFPEVAPEAQVSIGMRISAVQPPASRRGAGLPLAVPVLVASSPPGCDERVVACAAGVDREDVTGAAVLERVEDDDDVVLALEVAVPLLREAHDPRGLGVLAADPEHQGLRTRQHLHEPTAVRTVALPRLDHHQVRAGRGQAPLGLVEDTVDVQDRPEGTRAHDRVFRRLGEDGNGRSSDERRQREPPGARAAHPAAVAASSARGLPGPLRPPADLLPVHVVHEGVDVAGGGGAEVHVVGVLVHVQHQQWRPEHAALCMWSHAQ